MMDDLYDLFLKLYKEKNIDPNKRSDIVALGIVFDRNFQVKSFQMEFNWIIKEIY